MKNLILLFLLTLSTILNSQTTIVIQPDANTGKDAKVFSNDPSVNYGSDLDFIAATWTFSGDQGILRSMIQFDLSSIPPGATILDAKMSLFYNFVSGSAGQAGNNASYLKRITESWDENTVTWNSQPAFINANEVYLPESTTTDEDYENINVTSLLKDMLSDPGHSFGFMFMGVVESPLSSMKFFSSDASQTSQHPKLEITYTTDPVQCLTLQPGSEGKDAKVFSLQSDTNFGNDLDFIGAAWTFGGSNGFLRSFIQFDLSSIPANAEIISADLSLYYNTESSSAGQAGQNTASLQRVIDPWDEQTINWDNQPGATHADEIILAESSDAQQDYLNIDIKALISDILADPGNNNGIMLKQVTEDPLRSMKFASGDASNAAKHPKLEICYQISTATKEITPKDILTLPNPFNNSITLSNLHGRFHVSLTNLNGSVVLSRTIESIDDKILIDQVDNLLPGIYILRADGENGNFVTKVVKAR